MNLSGRIIATATPGDPLLPMVQDLLKKERQCWPLFRENEARLRNALSKRLAFEDGSVVVQSNPGRSRSIFARTDPASVAERPCFLCEQNLPPEEHTVVYGEYLIHPNPYPILADHLTVPAKDHVPQVLGPRAPALLKLARDLGPEMFVFYNGARCGASAPDHFHFQAASTLAIPLFDELMPAANAGVTARTTIGRNLLVFRHGDPQCAAAFVRGATKALSALSGEPDEPLFNLAATYRSGDFFVLFFPRSTHRPKRFFALDQTRLSVSPATLEMLGLVVVGEEEQFGQVDEHSVRSLYEEVCLSKQDFHRLLEELL